MKTPTALFNQFLGWLTGRNWKRNIVFTMLVLAALLVLLRECNKKTAPTVATPKSIVVDDTNKKIVEKYKRENDSLSVLLKRVEVARDSQIAINELLAARLEKRTNQFKEYYSKYVFLKDYKDTLEALIACDSALLAASLAMNTVDSLRKGWAAERLKSDSALRYMKDQIDKKESALSLTQASNEVLRSDLEASTKELKKYFKKANRNFSIGPYVGYGIDQTLQPRITLGVSLQYSLFKFKL